MSTIRGTCQLISILIGWGTTYKAVFDEGVAGKKIYREIKKYMYPNDDESLEHHVMKLEGFDGIEDLFDPEDFDKHIIGSDRKDRSMINSEVAKLHKKELTARLFLEKINSKDSVPKFKKRTKDNFNKVFDWLKK